jgi:glutamate synthase (NADPH/NADH) large chain
MKTRYQSGSCGVGFVCNIHGTKSHDVVKWGIEAVKNLTHRGAVGGDGKTGDGAGVLFQIPKKFFLREIEKSGYTLSHEDNLAIGFFFLSEDIRPGIETTIKNYGIEIIGWRDVPVNVDALGESALSTKPTIQQLFLDTKAVENKKREITLYLSRRAIEKAFSGKVYIASFSSKTIVYKGMLVAPQLDRFYPDLRSEAVESAFCIFHQRFSTNTFPDWFMAQPFRVLAHNGEINTIQGNRNWIATIEHAIGHELFGEQNDLLKPLLSLEESDSASLDRLVELLILSGFSPEQAVTLCIPPAWEVSAMNREEKGFFEYQSLLMTPWDGPAAITFTDGDMVGAHLDRNGLRPLRYALTEDGILTLGSEIGLVMLEGKTVKERGRLGPGDTLSVLMQESRLKYTEEIVKELTAERPYGDWIERFLLRLSAGKSGNHEPAHDTIRKQIAFGYSSEEIRTSLQGMAETAKEFIFSMGDDTPLPPLSKKPQLLFRYFKQRFSQVTNPPIDPIREGMVMSLTMNLGHKRNFLVETAEHSRRLRIDSPVLLYDHIREIEEQITFAVERISITYSKISAGEELSEQGFLSCCVPGKDSFLSIALSLLRKRVLKAVQNGAEILILTDKDISRERIAIPSLLAISAAVSYLRGKRLANQVSFIMETGEARDIHHMACLVGYGASAVYPYLAYQTIHGMCEKGDLKLPYGRAAANYKIALENGLMKVIARMGISTMSSYHGAGLFDALCLNRDLVEEFFKGTPLSIEFDGLSEIEDSLKRRHAVAFETPEPSLDPGGDLRDRKEGEWHAWSTSAVIALNKFIKSPDYALYKDFSRTADDHPVFLRDLLTYKKGNPLMVEEVESDKLILKRFVSGAMSVGALSPEAHETIAEACNRLGIKSNSGEGGEDPLRYWSIKNSAIKQIASGRFGVTPTYLASASDLEIKVAQGAKPGEGGHLPEQKVSRYIASLRHCSPNTLLISPPPHHDIYSIEDLAQLIHDLKQANPKASVCVKLVSEAGVGTVAAGVAKAYADVVQISGCEGGTGASPLSSIKNVGDYWETGLAETQAVLMENGLRQRVRVRVDGGLRTGKDIIIAALLGAEEFGFGTATMIAAGCVMARQCHLNTCPTGIATQDERLRGKFRGRVEWVEAYFRALAYEIRAILADMGFRSLDEVIGRSDLLTVNDKATPLAKRMKLDERFFASPGGRPRKSSTARNDNPAPSMNDRIVDDMLPYIEKSLPVEREYEIKNIDRSIPIRLNYFIALKYGDAGLPHDTVRLTFRGTAGQSFGAFNHKGVSLTLIGDANDYVGKGMFGGRIALRPLDTIRDPRGQVIAGNTVLYGATGGEFFAAGSVGERFAVRNSGATAVVEGSGLHLCEYMTRGTVVVLGQVGENVGAGMTGGTIYIFDWDNTLKAKLNASYVRSDDLTGQQEIAELRMLIERHSRYTESLRARTILSTFPESVRLIKKICPSEWHGKSVHG